jgi:hypothetical protein
MPSDKGIKIPVEIITTPVMLDKNTTLSNDRYVLGYLSADYNTDEDTTITIFARRGENLVFDIVDTIILPKGNKRFYRKLPLTIGSVVDYFCRLTGDFKEFRFTTLKLLVKMKTVGKNS